MNQVEVKEVIHIGNTPCCKEPLTIPGKDGDDAPLYLEKSIERVFKKLEQLQKQEQEKQEGEE